MNQMSVESLARAASILNEELERVQDDCEEWKRFELDPEEYEKRCGKDFYYRKYTVEQIVALSSAAANVGMALAEVDRIRRER